MSTESTGSAETPTYAYPSPPSTSGTVVDPVPVDAPPPTVVKKVGLIGFTASRFDAPYGDKEWTLAGCNNLWRQPGMDGLWQQCDAWYDLHSREEIDADPEHVEWLKTAQCFVMPNVRRDEWKRVKDFPYQQILDWAKAKGLAGLNYFTNSVSWMIAHAHMLLEAQGFDQGRGGEIGLWGIDMAVSGDNGTGEYQSQRPSCEYWIGVAEGCGVKVTVAERSDLLKAAGLYGIHDYTALRKKLVDREAELAANLAQATAEIERRQNEIAQISAQANQFQGALENARYIKTVWLGPEGTRKGGDDPSITQEVLEALGSGGSSGE